MGNKAKTHLSVKTLWVLFILGLVNAVMYCFPYIRYVFYDQQIAAMGITNTQSGLLMTIYAAANTITLIPGGILADKWSVKKCLVGSILGSVVIGVIYAITMNFAVACVLWAGLGVTTIFVFWAAITKAVGQVGTAEEQGVCYGIYYAASGIISAILNAVCLQVGRISEDPATSFSIAVWVMTAFTAVALILTMIFFEERHISESKSEDEEFKLQYVGEVLKSPMLWLFSIMVLCAYGLYTSVSYFSPYLTDVLGVSLVQSSFISIVRSNLMNLLCPIGGIIIDKIFKSSTKWYITAFGITIAIYAVVLIMPTGINPAVATVISLLPSAIGMMLYGVIWSGLQECKFKAVYAGTVIGIASIIGYLPDSFYYIIFGKWMDNYGNDAYTMIFGFLMATAAIGMIVTIIMRRLIKKNEEKEVKENACI